METVSTVIAITTRDPQKDCAPPASPISKGFVDSLLSPLLAADGITAAKEIAVKPYVVRLGAEERDELEALIRKGKSPAQRLLKARIEGRCLGRWRRLG